MLAHSQYTKREDKVKDKELILFLIRILYFFLVIVQAHKTTIDLFFCCFFLIFLWDLDDNTPRAFLVFFFCFLFFKTISNNQWHLFFQINSPTESNAKGSFCLYGSRMFVLLNF